MVDRSGSLKPLVSVIVPAHNAERYIQRSLRSIVYQSYKNIEILLVDDASSDSTVMVSRRIDDPRMTVLEGDGQGVSHARNVGIDAASGDLVMFVDADDEIVPDCIASAVALIEDCRADVVIGGLRKVWPNGSVVNYAIGSDAAVEFADEAISAVIEATVGYVSAKDSRLNASHLAGCCCRLIRRQQLERLRFEESLSIGEDTVFNVALLKRCTRVVVTPEIWYHYNQNPNSAVFRYREHAFQEGSAMLVALKAELGYGYDGAFMRRALFQLEGAVRQRVALGCPERTLFQKAYAVREALHTEFWMSFLDDSFIAPGLSIKHRGFLLLAKRRMTFLLCLAMKLFEKPRE